MDNSRFERIASALVREVIAKQMVADENVFVVIDEDGAQEVSEGQFNKIFASAKVRVAAENEGNAEVFPKWDEEDEVRDRKFPSVGHEWKIFVSPKVNALEDAADGLRGFPQKVKNYISTVMNRIRAKDKIDKVINQHDLYGYTIEKGEGRYPYTDKETGKRKVSKEDSYIITIYCFEPREVAFQIGEELRKEFKQKGVLVDVGRGGQSVSVD